MEPLASRTRPESLDEFIGQQHLVGEGKPLRIAITERHVFSFILWGPPGVGKTTLARIYAKSVHAAFFELSAVSAGKEDIRRIVNTPTALPGQMKVLFLDEIHRFNKSQQDFLLPYVESGALTLVGATTENPSFEVIAPLLSRARVFVLNELSLDEMMEVIKRAAKQAKMRINAKATEFLAELANGDARQALSMLEATHSLYTTGTDEHMKLALQAKFRLYDKKGD